jgi:hypothetical protein
MAVFKTLVRTAVAVSATMLPIATGAQQPPLQAQIQSSAPRPLVVYPNQQARSGASDPDREQPINLVCPGTVSVDRTSSTGIFSGGSFGLATGTKRIDFGDSIDVRVRTDNTGEARIPKKLLPLISDGGSAGWFPLINVWRSSSEITASVRMNANYKPKIRIDRMSGRITLQGALGDFSGACEAFDSTSQRKF